MEPSPERRAFADASGVDRAFDPKRHASDIQRLGVDAVLECSGNEHGARAGLNALAPQGTMIVVGGGAHAGLDPLTILLRELRVHGSFIYVDEFDHVIGLLADSALRVADLTTGENAGVVPDAFVDRILGVIDARRPFMSTTTTINPPQAGMQLVVPKIVTRPTVGLQSGEKVALASTDTSITTESFTGQPGRHVDERATGPARVVGVHERVDEQ